MSYEEFRNAQTRDLEEEVRRRKREERAKERAEIKSQPIECPGCGEMTTRGRELAHRKTLDCRATTKRAVMIALGYTVTHSDCWDHDVARAVGIEPVVEYTDTGKRHRAKVLKQQRWIPAWIPTLIGSSSWEVRGELSETKVKPLFVAFIKRCVEDPEHREAAEAAFRLGGKEAIARMVITPQVRAGHLRQQAADLIEQAMKKEAEANLLDPPSES